MRCIDSQLLFRRKYLSTSSSDGGDVSSAMTQVATNEINKPMTIESEAHSHVVACLDRAIALASTRSSGVVTFRFSWAPSYNVTG